MKLKHLFDACVGLNYYVKIGPLLLRPRKNFNVLSTHRDVVMWHITRKTQRHANPNPWQ